MKQFLLTAALATGVALSWTTASLGQTKSKRDPDVNKTLQRAYPDAQTQVMNFEDVNGTRVYNVNVTDKRGTSTAQVTEYGDFLNYGIPQQDKQFIQQIQKSAGQLFQSMPSDVQTFRSTTYLVDVPVQGAKSQTYQIRFDPVGRVLDIKDAKAVSADRPSEQKPADKEVAKKLEQIARERFADKEAQLQRVTETEVPGFYEVDFKGTAVTLNEQGQVLQVREDMTGKELPQPVKQTMDQLVKNPSRVQRLEEEYLQFNQQSGTGNQITVKMRPDGDIIDVVNIQAAQEEQAVTAKHKQGAQPAQKKPGS